AAARANLTEAERAQEAVSGLWNDAWKECNKLVNALAERAGHEVRAQVRADRARAMTELSGRVLAVLTPLLPKAVVAVATEQRLTAADGYGALLRRAERWCAELGTTAADQALLNQLAAEAEEEDDSAEGDQDDAEVDVEEEDGAEVDVEGDDPPEDDP